ncbi:MAG: tRNA-uridine aminocarboxypropyltransferase, partial [Myxococcota bacterium]
MSERAMARDYCYRCFKSARLCVCDIEAVENQTEVFIVQHPAERQHPINTARLTVLGLTRARIDVEWNREIAAPQNLPEHSVVLFPSSHSRDLESYAPEERPQGLVVLDGTWSQARKLYLRNSWLQELPHVHLKPSAPSRYR